MNFRKNKPLFNDLASQLRLAILVQIVLRQAQFCNMAIRRARHAVPRVLAGILAFCVPLLFIQYDLVVQFPPPKPSYSATSADTAGQGVGPT